jgi:hypothetical protein
VRFLDSLLSVIAGKMIALGLSNIELVLSQFSVSLVMAAVGQAGQEERERVSLRPWKIMVPDGSRSQKYGNLLLGTGCVSPFKSIPRSKGCQHTPGLSSC